MSIICGVYFLIKTGKIMARQIALEFASNEDVIYTARAGLVPINEIAKKLKLPKAINDACSGVRDERYTTYRSSELVLFRVYGHLAGLHRVDQVLKSAEFPFLAKLAGLDKAKPVDTTFGRFYEGFAEDQIRNLQRLNFNLATRKVIEVSGFRILVHDQSAIQKYGSKMEGVEKGYGGTLKRGAKMLQASMIVDAGMNTIPRLEICVGARHSNFNATAELGEVLEQMPKAQPGKVLVLGDSAYGIGDYMRKCDEYNANFILAVKNDKWMKAELEVLDFKRFKPGKDAPDYGYREFVADRDVWNSSEGNELFGDSWEGARRVVVVRLPAKTGEDTRYQFLVTTLPAEKYAAEDVHALYRKNREAIEQVNNEIKNQLGLTELPSHELDANRAIAQVVALAWNLQRHVEHVGMASERRDEAVRRAHFKIPKSRKLQRRYEWWTLFVRFITIGGKVKVGGNKTRVIVGNCESTKRWLAELMAFDWSAYALAR